VHELSIALSILDIVRDTCAGQGCGRVEKVRVRVGKASGVMPDSLLFSFDCAKSGTPAAEASLEIEEIPVGGHCRDCAADFTVDEKYVMACPLCGGAGFTVESGHELEVVDLEVDE
jgi:hydrogenase nickel incorporation protein HypA/HybF